VLVTYLDKEIRPGHRETLYERYRRLRNEGKVKPATGLRLKGISLQWANKPRLGPVQPKLRKRREV